MYEFLQTLEKKRAFKKALKEVFQENPEPIVSNEKKVVSAASNPKIYSYAFKNPLRKPETTAIDLKYFKDWRNTDTVKSNAPKQKQEVNENEDTDESVLTPPWFDGKAAPTEEVNSIDVMEKFAAIPKEETKDTDINTYLAQQRVEPVKRKITLQQLVDRFNTDKVEESAPRPPVNKVKVEVVDFTEKSTPKPKAPAKRRPRGKSKRKFDADVISSVDWK